MHQKEETGMKSLELLETIKTGQMIFLDQFSTSLPLQKTSVNVQIIGGLATVLVTQEFYNPLKEPAEIEYLFPLPHQAAISDFEIKIGNRTVRSNLEEFEKALDVYQEAVRKGKLASLLEKRRPNLFAVRVANVQPENSIQTLIRFQERLAFHDGEYEFVFPMGITPRYHSSEHIDESKGLDFPISSLDEPVGLVDISIGLDAGIEVVDVKSPSHKLDIAPLDGRKFNIRLAEPTQPDHDFILRYKVAQSQITLIAWRSKGQNGDFFLISLVPPTLDEVEIKTTPREFFFVLDRSGSMTGEPIAQARNALRACLRILNPEDTFNILLFDDQIEWYQPESSSVNQKEIERADHFLENVQGRGGTEIIQALNASLSIPMDKKRARYMIFLTDGAVSAEERALQIVGEKIGDTNLFTFGIGPSVNRAFIQNLAKLGHGLSEFLQLDEDIEGAILRFQDKISFPVLTDIKMECENAKLWDVYPALFTNLYIGEPLEIVGRIQPNPGKSVKVRFDGKQNLAPVHVEILIPDMPQDEPAIARAWAQARISDLENKTLSSTIAPHKSRDEILSLAFEYRLITSLTAFVAVDSEGPESKKKSQKIFVAQPLPKGLELEGFFGVSSQRNGSLQMMALAAPSRPVDPLKLSEYLAEDFGDAADDIQNQKMHRVAEQSSQAFLRELIRAQNLDGSWEENPELSSSALLLFIRSGHLPNRGNFRIQMQRALGWLKNAQLSGFEAILRAIVFSELALATGKQKDQVIANEFIDDLSQPSSSLEQNAMELVRPGITGGKPPAELNTMDDLRLAGLFCIHFPISEDNFKDENELLVNVWSLLNNPNN